MSRSVPIALFAYNRPRHTDRALRALARCADLEHCNLHIYCDGSKQPEHLEMVNATRGVAEDWGDRLGAQVVMRKQNLGLSKSIAGTVGELADKYGSVIVLEDDLVPAPDFLSFMLAGLETYEHDDRIAQISGSLLVPEVDCATEGLFLPLTTTWGWATWARAWAHFPEPRSVNLSGLERDPAFKARFTLDGRADYIDMLERRLADANDSWGILWWFSVAKANRLVLYPRTNLVWNGGFDGSGIHCDGQDVYREDAPADFPSRRLSRPVSLPEHVAVDEAILEQIVRDYFGGADMTTRRVAPAVKARQAIGRAMSRFGSYFTETS